MAMTPKMLTRTALLPVVLVLAGGLTACSGKKTEVADPASASRKPPEDFFNIDDITGSLRTAPDEFSVVTKKPLEMPDSLDVLPPPEPGKLSSRDPNPIADARSALLGETRAASNGAPSSAERAILSAAGQADPNIRATMESEQAEYQSGQQLYILDRYIPALARLRGETAVGALDPVAERERLVQQGILAPALPGAPVAGTAQTATISTPAIQPAPAPVTTQSYIPAPSQVSTAPITTAPAPAPVSGTPTFGGPIQQVPDVEGTTGLIYIE